MQIELKPAHVNGKPSPSPTDFNLFIDAKCHGYLYLSGDRWVLALGLPGHNVEYGPVFLDSKEAAIAKALAIAPHLVGAPVLPPDPHSPEAADAALYYALELDSDGRDGMEFLRQWCRGPIAAAEVRALWPEAPEDAFGTVDGPHF